VFAIRALERAAPDELQTADYMMHRRELHIRLAKALSPSGGRFGASAEVRLDVPILRGQYERLVELVTGGYPGELTALVGRALDAGLQTIAVRERRRRAKKRR